MASRALNWLVKQYRCVLGKERVREHLMENHPGYLAARAREGTPAVRGGSEVVERLEERVMMAHDPHGSVSLAGLGGARAHQLFYLDVDGAEGVNYEGPVSVRDMDVPAFRAPAGMEGQEERIVGAVMAALEQAFDRTGVGFTIERPSMGTEFSTVYLGGDGSQFAQWGQFYGLAERVDEGNVDTSDLGFVFTDVMARGAKSMTQYARRIADVVAHEAGH